MTASALHSMRPGVLAARITPARFDRLHWIPDTSPERLRPGTIERRPTAVAAHSTLHRAVATDGSPAWVRRLRGGSSAAVADSHMAARLLIAAHGIRVPDARAASGHQVWLGRHEWSPKSEPAVVTVDWFVESALRVALEQGVIVALGEPHICVDSGVVVEDVGIAALLEPDERVLVRRLCACLIDADPLGVSSAVSQLCGEVPVGIAAAARRAALSLAVDWTPTGFGLSLHHVAACATQAGRRAMPLRLLADEVLHRLDLAHRHPAGVRAFSNRAAVKRMLSDEVRQ